MNSFDFGTVFGLMLLLGGLAFRIWSIRILGYYFTATVRTQANQQIITTGAYRIIRHPSYLGAYLVVVGSAVFLHAYAGIVISAIVMFLRISIGLKPKKKRWCDDSENRIRSIRPGRKSGFR